MSLSLSLLGVFQAVLNGQPITDFYSSKVRALLAYLAVEAGRQHPRSTLAALLWPDWDDRAALGNLRFSLSRLRQALGDQASYPSFLLASRDAIQLNPEADVELDVRLFRQELRTSSWESAEADGQPASTVHSAVEHLRAAMALYRGPFLEGFSVGDSAAFEEWALIKREELARGARWALHGLTALTCRLGDYASAERHVRRLLDMDPWDELANRRLMLLLLQEGQRNAAIQHYAAYQAELARELGCEPEEETQALYHQIRDGGLPLSTSPPLAMPASYPLSIPASPPLPRFVAREQELAQLAIPLDRALTGTGGLALIPGEAGAGKTALLDEFARRASQTYGDLIVLRGSCNAYGGTGDPYLPFREILQTLAGDVEGKRAGGTLTLEQAQRAWQALPAVGAALVAHGPDLIDTFVSGEALLQRVEGFPALRLSLPGSSVLPNDPGLQGAGAPLGHRPSGQAWQTRLWELVRRAGERTAPPPQAGLFAQVTQVLHAVSLDSPLLLIIDDLQWADGGTAALLFHLGRRLAGSRILLTCAYRPEVTQELSDLNLTDSPSLGAVLQELTRQWGDVLVNLDRADGRAFVEAYVDSKPNCLGAGFRQALYDHTEGNPLFTVELLYSFERDGTLVRDEAGRWVESAAPDWAHWPPQVDAVIARHLAGLPDEDQALLQAAAVQGEEFIAEVAARALGVDETASARRLSGPLTTRHRLVRAVSLDRLASTGQRLSHYRFRHLLVQRSAYRSLDAVERARLHEATGRALEAIYAPQTGAGEERPPALALDLARHFEAAGMPLPAARALHDAGRQATALSAHREALSHFDHGLALLADEPPSKERAEVQRLLALARLGPQRNLAGMGASEVESAFAQVAQAGAGDGHGRPTLRMLLAEVELLSAKGSLEEALTAAMRLLDQATDRGDEASAASARYFMAMAYNLMGRLQEAEIHFQWLLAWLTPQRRAELWAIMDVDPLSHTLGWVALNHWFLGYPEQALRDSNQALAVAVEEGDPYGQARASALGSITLFLLRAAPAMVRERSELCHRLCLENGYSWWQAYSNVFLGWLAVTRGEDAGIERMRSAMAAWQATGMEIGTDNFSLVLADGYLVAVRRRTVGNDAPAAVGAEAERASLLATALAAIDSVLGPKVPCGQSYQAELHRVRGELLLARDGLAAAEEALACFERAMRIGAEQGALAWELRAAMSLVRLRQRQGEAYATELAEALSLLREVYGRFTEGFDTVDLVEAKALLDELSS